MGKMQAGVNNAVNKGLDIVLSDILLYRERKKGYKLEAGKVYGKGNKQWNLKTEGIRSFMKIAVIGLVMMKKREKKRA